MSAVMLAVIGLLAANSRVPRLGGGSHARALAEGLPYQTLIASLLHKYASGRLKERSSRVDEQARQRRIDSVSDQSADTA